MPNNSTVRALAISSTHCSSSSSSSSRWVQQALDVLVSHLLHDLLQAVLWGDVLFPVAAVLAKGGKLQRQGVAQLLVALKANHPADAHHAGRGGKGAPRQLPNGKGGGLVRVVQNELRNLQLGAAEGGLHLPQA